MQTPDDLTNTEQVADPQAKSLQPGQNIILLSDGTGNSAAKLNKTNVWRLYHALEVNDGTQIAFYDDGVGTSGFKPLKLLGGALGVGLARNVRDLYRLLCQHYRGPDEDYAGDRIYIFGFSRGAFTARILTDLIVSCGILDRGKSVPTRRFAGPDTPQIALNTEQGLSRGVKLAYKAYRRKYPAPVFARWFRALRDALFGSIPTVEAFRQSYSHADDEPIEAIGVWDTVAAYGLPIHELTVLVDRLFYKLRFQEHSLSHKVGRAYHAIAIDDERHSFHPLLWAESKDPKPERIQQVWFSGMHSDVGGGYPNGDLSLLSLNWMINGLIRKPGEQEGLVFSAPALNDIRRRVATAPMHDSRSGLSIYYRYKPRLVDKLNNDPEHGVFIKAAKIHESVLERIRHNTDGYSPAGLPASYDLVDDTGKSIEPNPYEKASNQVNRDACQVRVQNHVYWRRVNYFLTVFATLALLLLPFYRPPVPGLKLSGFQSFIGWFLERLDPLLPAFMEKWTAAWTQSPYLFAALALILTGLIVYARRVARFIHRLAEAGWWPVKLLPGSTPGIPEAGIFERLAAWIRGHALAKQIYRWSDKVLPIIALLAVLYVLVGAVYRLGIHDPLVRHALCNRPETMLIERNKFGQSFIFDTRMPCLDTGLSLVAGKNYIIELDLADKWKDYETEASNEGLSRWYSRFHPAFLAALPARRHISVPWFGLIGEIGRDSGQIVPLRLDKTEFRAPESGTLYLYVNDAINALSIAVPSKPAKGATPICELETYNTGESARSTEWCGFYTNNLGTASIVISEME